VHPPRVENQVLAVPEVFVQLQCVNLIRQHLARHTDKANYDYLPSFKGGEETVMRRADQCVERLRHTLMCWSDLGTILQGLEEEPGKEPRSFLDFATLHKCRNFDAVRDWTVANAVRAVKMDNAWWGGRVFA